MPSPTHRRSRLRSILLSFLIFVPLLLTVGCSRIAPGTFSRNIDELLAIGRSYASSRADRPAESLTDEEVLALGYLERARLGLGSPFRLVAYVMRDPRLSSGVREPLAYAILDLTLAGRGYQADPLLLDRVRLAGVPRQTVAGGYHLRLIEQTIRQAPTPESGERAVRVGYALAEAERSVTHVAGSAVTYIAALVADRHRARADAADLLRAASAERRDPLVLLGEWRQAMRFRVERPALAPVTDREEMAATQSGLRLASSLRLLGQRLSAPVSLVPESHPGRGESAESWLTPEVAARLDVLAVALDYPPQAPIAVAVNTSGEILTARPGLDPVQQERRLRFVETAWNEERLVAGAAKLRGEGTGGVYLSMTEVRAAAFLRAWNQEDPWFPGDAAPAAKDIEARFGLAGIVFDSEVPDGWRPYYRRAIGRALADLQRVLPTASFRGLTLRVGALPSGWEALALHDPRARTIYLPPETGAGTLAHEVAHDLDWQLARSRYGKRGGYATDLAVQERPRDRIATSLNGLAASFAHDSGDAVPGPHPSRPAEVFARGMDWFVAAVLSREGRTGGYLTSFQDPAITGYGSTRSPDASGATVFALLSILDHIAPVVPDTRAWALDRYGPSRTISSMDVVRVITGAGADLAPHDRLDAIEQARDRALHGMGGASCAVTGGEEARRFIAGRRELIRAAAGAAGRGAVIGGVRDIVGELRPGVPRAAVDTWLAWRLYGAPEPKADSVFQELLPAIEPLLLRAAEVSRLGDISPGPGFSFSPDVTLCTGNPFAGNRRMSGGAAITLPAVLR